MYNKNMSFQLLAFKVNSYVIMSQKDLPFSGTIEIQNLKGEQSIGKKSGKCRQKRCVACGVCENTCPLAAVKVYHGCYAVVEETVCVGCGKCAKSCPAGCIEMKERTAM